MGFCWLLLCHMVENSTSYLLIKFAFFVALYEIWKIKEKVRENINSTILATITYFLSILEVSGIQILQLCCLKEEIKQKKIISAFENINKTLSAALKNVKKRRNAKNQNAIYRDILFLSSFNEQFTEFDENMKDLRNELRRIKLEKGIEITHIKIKRSKSK